MLLSEWWAVLKGQGVRLGRRAEQSPCLWKRAKIAKLKLSHTNQDLNPGSEEVEEKLKIPEQNALLDEAVWNRCCFKEIFFFSVNKGLGLFFCYNNISEVFICWYIVLFPESFRSQKVVLFFLLCLLFATWILCRTQMMYDWRVLENSLTLF